MSATPSPVPWDYDAVRNEGEYGDGGPDSHIGFDSFAILDVEGRVLFDSLNRDGAVTEVDQESDDEAGYHRAWDRLAQVDAQHVVRCVNAHDDLLALARGVEQMLANQKWTGVGEGLENELLRAARAVIAKAQGGAA